LRASSGHGSLSPRSPSSSASPGTALQAPISVSQTEPLPHASAPAHTPEPILDKLHADMAAILQDKAFVDGFVRPQGFTVHPMSRQAFVAQVRADYALWGRMAEAAGLKRN